MTIIKRGGSDQTVSLEKQRLAQHRTDGHLGKLFIHRNGLIRWRSLLTAIATPHLGSMMISGAV